MAHGQQAAAATHATQGDGAGRDPLAPWQLLLLQTVATALQPAEASGTLDETLPLRMYLARHLESGQHFRLLRLGDEPAALVEPCDEAALALVDLDDPTGWMHRQRWEWLAEVTEEEIWRAALARAPQLGTRLTDRLEREPAELLAELIAEIIGVPELAAQVPATEIADLAVKLASLATHLPPKGHGRGRAQRHHSPLAGQDALRVPSSRLLPVAWRGMYRPEAWVRRSDGGPPYYAEGTNGVYLHPTDGEALLTPEQEASAWQQVVALDDNTVRAFFVALGAWFAETGGDFSKGKARIDVHTILAFQGIKPNKRAYRATQKEQVARDIWALSNIFIKGKETIYDRRGRPKEVTVKSRLLEVAQEDERDLLGEEIPYAMRVAPGDWAKPLLTEGMRQTAALLVPVLRYDLRQGVGRLAGRLGLYLTFQWRIRASHDNYAQPWRITTLLEQCGLAIPPPHDRKGRLRLQEYFETALDRLRDDAVLGGWEYAEGRWEDLPPQGAFATWLTWTVRITPPTSIISQYAEIGGAAEKTTPSARIRSHH